MICQITKLNCMSWYLPFKIGLHFPGSLGGSLLRCLPHCHSVCGLRCLLSDCCPHCGSSSFTQGRPSHMDTRDAPEIIYFWDLNVMQLQNDSVWLKLNKRVKNSNKNPMCVHKLTLSPTLYASFLSSPFWLLLSYEPPWCLVWLFLSLWLCSVCFFMLGQMSCPLTTCLLFIPFPIMGKMMLANVSEANDMW